MNRGVMMYDPCRDRWIVKLNGTIYGVHCGESFELVIGSHNISCRLELDDQWYIIMQDVRLNLRAHDSYIVNI
jgi:hypothetical protein